MRDSYDSFKVRLAEVLTQNSGLLLEHPSIAELLNSTGCTGYVVDNMEVLYRTIHAFSGVLIIMAKVLINGEHDTNRAYFGSQVSAVVAFVYYTNSGLARWEVLDAKITNYDEDE